MRPPLILALAMLLVLAVPAFYTVSECRRHLGIPAVPVPQSAPKRSARMPQTNLGRWTGWLLLIVVALFVWLVVGINSGGLLPGSPLIRTVGLSLSATAVSTFVLALVSRFKLEDRAAVVVVAMAIGGVLTILAALELVG